MKLLPYPQLPFFNEMMTVLRKNHISSWQANDFWKKIRQDFDVEKTNINYQNVYRFILRLEREKFLIIDSNKNEMGCTTYSETLKLEEFREQFCQQDDVSFIKIKSHCQILKSNIRYLEDEILTINDLKCDFPEFSLQLNDLYTIKLTELTKLKGKLNVLNQLMNRIQN
ncbi:hypothetical protein [Acinetobacter pittii]|uniref:hypothetical protein n=1 Tax=Acinetobacter pittii TaxID=48296 RepID=UPI00192C7EB4|nr:hypothetical protein [Acinetobacter pittii]